MSKAKTFKVGDGKDIDPAVLSAINATVRDAGLQIVFAGVRNLGDDTTVEDHISFSATVLAALIGKIAISVEDTLVALQEVGRDIGTVSAEHTAEMIYQGALRGIADSRRRRNLKEGPKADDKVH